MLALLLAVLTGILFSAAPRITCAAEYGHGDERIAAGQHDIPVVSRQQEALDRFVRREEDRSPHRPFPLHRHCNDLDLVERCALVAWPLPAPSELRRPGHVVGWTARGPPTVF